MATIVSTPQTDTRFFGHPRGLATLFFTEMWERFSYYGMRAILILFMTAPAASGGLGFSVATAGVIYGLYTSMVYLMSVPGGWLADRVLGQRRAVFYGGIGIVIGQLLLGITGVAAFYAGLIVLVLGTGLLKPNISTIVGKLYAEGDVRRDAGFSVFYMGINIGATIAPLIVGYVGQRINWNLGFVLAGFGMVIGLIQYVLGRRYMGEAGLEPVRPETADARARQNRLMWIGALVLVAMIGVPAVLNALGAIQITAGAVGDAAGVVLLLVSIGVFAWLLASKGWSTVERQRIVAMVALFIACALFFAAYEQAGSTLTLLADRSTDNHAFGWAFPSSWYQALSAIFVVALAPAFAVLWIKLGKREPSIPVKFSLGLLLVGLGFAVVGIGALRAASGVRISPMWLVATYFIHVCGELCLSPVGLSAFTKLAPAKIASLMMGVWFLGISVGEYIGGIFGSLYEKVSPATLFAIVAAFAMGAGVIMALLIRPLKRLMAGVK